MLHGLNFQAKLIYPFGGGGAAAAAEDNGDDEGGGGSDNVDDDADPIADIGTNISRF